MNPYNALLLASAAIVWALLILAKFAEYDSNYVFAIFALMASSLVTLAILLVWLFRRGAVTNSVFSTAAFLITSSPISICLFVWLYSEVIGMYFKL